VSSQPPGGLSGEPLGSEYLMFEQLGQGAMGTVRRARTRAGDPVAVKVLRPDLSGDQALVARFVQERSILTGLRHPNIVRVRDLVVENSTLAIVMDLVNGNDLRTELDRAGTFAPADAVQLTIDVLRGLSAVHAAGVVHRDLKPENVLMDLVVDQVTQGRRVPKLTDFGISTIASAGRRSHRTGAIGTPEYMAPELIGDGVPSRASDIYAVGVMLYEFLTGTTPFQAGSALALMNKHVHQAPGRPEGIPDPLWGAISGMLAKDPAQRPQDAERLAAQLEGLLPGLAGLRPLPRLAEPPPPPPGPVRDDGNPTVIRDLGASRRDTERITGAGTQRSGRGRRIALIAGALVVLLAAVAVVVVLLMQDDDDPGPGPAPSPSPVTTTTVPPSPTPSLTPVTPGPTPSEVAESAAPGPSPEGAYVLPDYTGQQLADVVTDLTNRDVGYSIEPQYDPSGTNNEVVAQNPPAGQAAGSRVRLTVVRTAEVTYLTSVGLLGEQPDIGPVTVDNVDYPNSLSDWICSGYDDHTYEWQIPARAQRLTGFVGLTNDSSSQDTATFEVFVDGTRRFTGTGTLSRAPKVNVDVTGGQRLKIVVTATRCGDDPISSRLALAQLTFSLTPGT